MWEVKKIRYGPFEEGGPRYLEIVVENYEERSTERVIDDMCTLKAAEAIAKAMGLPLERVTATGKEIRDGRNTRNKKTLA